jgi:hypothetical protein
MSHLYRLANAALALALLGMTPGIQAKEQVARAAPPARAARRVVLDEKTAGKAIHVRAARNLLTTVELPEDLLGVTCPDCSDGKNPGADALFHLETAGQGRYLTITPNAGGGRRRAVDDPVTTVLIRLEHATLLLYLERVERKRLADTRLILAYPNRPADSEYLRAEKAKFEAEAMAKIESEVSGRFLRAFSEPHHCTGKGGRVRSEDIVLEVTELCYFGRDVIIAFKVENRGRLALELGPVEVNRGAHKREYLSRRTVEFQEVSDGVVSVRLPEGDASTAAFELTVRESAGKQRRVTIGGLEL